VFVINGLRRSHSIDNSHNTSGLMSKSNRRPFETGISPKGRLQEEDLNAATESTTNNTNCSRPCLVFIPQE